MELSSEFLSYFSALEGPRVRGRNLRHKLEDMFAIAILAVVCGADNWGEISRFASAKEAWLKSFLELPNGIPSHDTFGRVFALLDAGVFEQCFVEWAHSLPVLMEGSLKREIIAVACPGEGRGQDVAPVA